MLYKTICTMLGKLMIPPDCSGDAREGNLRHVLVPPLTGLSACRNLRSGIAGIEATGRLGTTRMYDSPPVRVNNCDMRGYRIVAAVSEDDSLSPPSLNRHLA